MFARSAVAGLEWPILTRITSRDDNHNALVHHPRGDHSPGIRGKSATFSETGTDNVRLFMTQIQNFV